MKVNMESIRRHQIQSETDQKSLKSVQRDKGQYGIDPESSKPIRNKSEIITINSTQ